MSPFAPRVTPVTACLENPKVLKKYDTTWSQRFDTNIAPGVFSEVEVSMFRISNPIRISIARGVFGAVVAFFVMGAAPRVEAQSYCQEWTDVLLDTTYSCVSSPLRERAFGTETFTFGGNEYLMLNRGNEFGLYRISDADRYDPRNVDDSSFRFGTAGDSDYDLMAFDVCDDCRYGVMDHKVAGVVLFDLGTGAEPQFRDWAKYSILNQGSVTFKVGSTQYVVAVGVDGEVGV